MQGFDNTSKYFGKTIILCNTLSFCKDLPSFSLEYLVFANTTNSNWLNLEYKKLRYTICISECTYQLCCTWPEEWEPPFHTGWSCLSGPPWEPGWSLWWQCGTAGVVVPRSRWDWLPHGFQAAWIPGLGKLAEPIFWQDKNISSFQIYYIPFSQSTRDFASL